MKRIRADVRARGDHVAGLRRTTTGATWATGPRPGRGSSTSSGSPTSSTTPTAGKAGTGARPTPTASGGGWATREHYDLLEDALRHTELVIHWGNDPDSTHGIYGGNESAQWRLWLREQGKKQIFIDPFFNYTAAHVGEKWISYRPGTGAAMALAIAHVWITEGTYDEEYVATRTLGFEDFCAYVLGEEDGVAKTPEWAAELCDVPARTITALAREWASHRTSLAGGTKGGEGGACRQAYATESARLMVLLQAMQGLGKPGVSIWGTANGPPYNATLEFPGYAAGGFNLIAEKRP